MLNFPINIDLTKFSILVVGGGKVAYRKVKAILPFIANLTVLSPVISSLFDDIIDDENILFIGDSYSSDYLSGIRLCIAATDKPNINHRIVDDCNKRNILCNSVSNPDYGHITFPCFFRDSDIIISVSTSGKAPILAKKLRDKIKEDYSKKYYLVAKILGELREIYNTKLPSDSKEAFWNEVVDLALSNSDLSNFKLYVEEIYNKF